MKKERISFEEWVAYMTRHKLFEPTKIDWEYCEKELIKERKKYDKK